MRFGNSNSHFVAVENFAAQLHEMATSNFSFGQTLHQMNVDDNQSIKDLAEHFIDNAFTDLSVSQMLLLVRDVCNIDQDIADLEVYLAKNPDDAETREQCESAKRIREMLLAQQVKIAVFLGEPLMSVLPNVLSGLLA